MPRSAVTLQEAADTFIQLREADLTPGTLHQYRLTLHMFVRRTGPNLGMKSLSATHMEAFFITGPSARARSVAPATYNKERMILNTFVRFCAARNWCSITLMDSVKSRKRAQKARLLLSPNELVQALEMQTHPRDRIIVAMGLNTALRASEIASLKIGDVDLANGWLYTTLHKTRKTDRFPISADLDTELRRWMKWYTEKVGPLHEDYYLVPARAVPNLESQRDPETGIILPDPDGPVRPTASCLTYIRLPVHRALTAMGYPIQGEGLHTLRRSVARAYYDMLVSTGCDDPLRVTQQMLNHSSAITTERYIGVETERRKRDDSLRGKPFLSSLVQHGNVIPLNQGASSG